MLLKYFIQITKETGYLKEPKIEIFCSFSKNYLYLAMVIIFDSWNIQFGNRLLLIRINYFPLVK